MTFGKCGLVGGWLGVTMALGGCGDGTPARDVVDADTASDVAPEVLDDVAEPDATVAPDVNDAADAVDTGDDTASDATDAEDAEIDAGEVTAEQAAILGVPESVRFELPGLSGPVHVVRSAGDLPHIYASNRNDLGRALGFIVARDRYFVMDLVRRLGLGTVSELFGSLAIGSDLESRQMGLTYVVDRLVEHVSPELADYLSAYADGINAYIEAVRNDSLPAPTETQYAGLLGYASAADMMKPFALRDVISLLGVFLYQSNFEGGDVGRAARAARLDELFAGATDEALRRQGFSDDVWNDVRQLFPDTNSSEGFGVGKSRPVSHAAKPRAGGDKPLPAGMAQRLNDKIEARMLTLGRDREAGFGSNAWAVAGAKTADGRALFAGDGHLELTTPALMYGAGVDTKVFAPTASNVPPAEPGVRMFGGWALHFPVMMAGTNGDTAWSGVNPGMDITDWYREELQLDASGKPKASFFLGEWHDLVATGERYVIADIPLLDSVGGAEEWTSWQTFDGRRISSVEGRPAAGPDDAGPGESVINLLGDLVVPADIDGDGVVTAISFDHVAFDATRWGDNLYELGHAKTVEDINEATRGFVGGGLFTLAADGTGSVLFSSYQAVPCRGYLPRGDDNVFLAGADPTRLLDGTEYGAFEIPTDATGKTDEGPGATDPYKCIVPHTQMPYAIDPDSGIVFSANSDPGGLSDDGDERNDAYHIGGPWASTRANTIRRELLEDIDDGGATVDDMKELHANHDSRLGEVFVPYLMAALDLARGASDGPLAMLYGTHGERLDEAQGRLAEWAAGGFKAASGVETFYDSPSETDKRDAVGTMIFNAWIRRFPSAVWGDEPIDGWRAGTEAQLAATLRFLAGRGPNNPSDQTSWNPATGESVFFDRLGTEAIESSDELLVQALVDALAFLESTPSAPADGGFGTPDMSVWLWGMRHQARLESILLSYGPRSDTLALITNQFAIDTERIPLMDNLPQGDPRRALTWFPRHGDQWGVDAANPGFGGDFTHGSGPAYRLIVALKDGQVEGHFVIPGGQSGIVASPHFDDQLKLWLANDYLKVLFTPAEVAAGALGRELFVPAP